MLLPAATKLGQGYVFTGVCDSVHRGGGCLPQCMLGCQTPPPGSRHPPPQIRHTTTTSPRQGTSPPPGSRHPPDQAHPPGPGTPPRNRHTTTPPPSRYPPPGSRRQHTVNERPVRILLECTLVLKAFILSIIFLEQC